MLVVLRSGRGSAWESDGQRDEVIGGVIRHARVETNDWGFVEEGEQWQLLAG